MVLEILLSRALTNQELGSILKPEENLAILNLFLRNSGPQVRRKAGVPCLAILSAQALSAGRLFRSPPRGYVNGESLTLEPITMQGALHLGSDWLLKWGAEKWLLRFREADAVLRKDRMRLECFLCALDSL